MENKYVTMQTLARILNLILVFIKVALKLRSMVYHAYRIRIRIHNQLAKLSSALISKV